MDEQEFRTELRDIAKSAKGLVSKKNPTGRKRFQQRLTDFRKMRNEFQEALQRAKKKAIHNPDLWCYDRDAEPPQKGLEPETFYLVKIWTGGFWRRPDRELPCNRKEEDMVIKEDWKAAQANPRLRNKKKIPKKDWVWEKRNREIGFWRDKLAFNPDAWLSLFAPDLMIGAYYPHPEEAPTANALLLCQYALIAVIHDYNDSLEIPADAQLTNSGDSWAYHWWDGIRSVLPNESATTTEHRAFRIADAFHDVEVEGDVVTKTGGRIKKRGGGVLDKQVSSLLMSSPDATARGIARILNDTYAGKYEPTSETSVKKTNAWKVHRRDSGKIKK